MNLLEYIQQSLNGPKKTLAVQLLRKPWNADLQLLSNHVPNVLYEQFANLQRNALIRLDRMDGKSSPFFGTAVDGGMVKQTGLGPGEWNKVGSDGDMLRVNQIWPQVVEDLEESGRASRLLDEADRAIFMLLYTLAHACFFVLAKVLDFGGQHGRSFALAPSPDAADAKRLYWYARYCSWQSMFSDQHRIHSSLESAKKDGRPMHEVFHALSDELASLRDYLSDKYLSLHPEFMHLMHEKDQFAVRKMNERLGLIVHIYLCSLQQQTNAEVAIRTLRFDSLLAAQIDVEDLRRAQFSNSVISELVDECMRKPIGDRFLVDVGGGRLQLGDISLKYAMQTLGHTILSRMDSRGEWFEQDYIANYIRARVPADRYQVFKGVKDKIANYDADVIIEDRSTGALFFCQVKHRTTTLLPHLRDETKEYMENEQIQHGLAQLKNLRGLMGSAGVLTRVKQRTGQRKLTEKSLIDRARYLLIHNIENLDFCTSEGIAMYEWNTLRNLLRRTMQLVGKGGSVSVATFTEDINLDDPRQVMETMCRWMETKVPMGLQVTPSMHLNGLRKSGLVFQVEESLYFKRLRLVSSGAFGFSVPVV